MKVQGPRGTSSTAPARKARKTSGAAAGAFADALKDAESTDGAQDTAAPHTSGSIAGVGTLLAVQSGADRDPREQMPREQMVAKANSLLDRLENIREAILMGRIPAQRLNALIGELAEQRAELDDPVLNELLDEIELRARVELAKYTP